MSIQRLVTALDAVTATTTSEAISVKEAKKVTLAFTRADHSSGSSTFSVTGTVDGTTYVTLNKLITNVTNTNAQTPVRAASVALSSDTTEIATLDMEGLALLAIKVKVVEVTDGTHTALVSIEN